jgi:cytidylate kinase
VNPSTPLQIAIDGPAASGKTTVARLTAARLHALYLDTGAMYRALAYLALQTGTDVDNGAALARLVAAQPIDVVLDESAPLGFRIFAGGRELDEAVLQSNEVTAIVSTIAAHAEVRSAMVLAQRRVAGDGRVVMAGRDIGTVVLPDAPVKIFLTASVAARVARRLAQMKADGVEIDAQRLAEEIEERDRIDRTRAVSPLEPAPDAHIIDSSDITADEVVDEICALVAPLDSARGDKGEART